MVKEGKESGQRRCAHEREVGSQSRRALARGATRTGTSGYGSKRKRLQQFAEWAARVAGRATTMSGTGARCPGALGGAACDGRVAADGVVRLNGWTGEQRAVQTEVRGARWWRWSGEAGRYGGEVQDEMTVSLQRRRSSRSGVPRAAESSGGGTCGVSG